jgi:hypothetical protein
LGSAEAINMEQTQPVKYPKVFIGIPIGPPKLYSTPYMIASLANLEYPNVELHWAVTGGEDNPLFAEYHERLTKFCEATLWPKTWTNTIHYVSLTKEQRNQSYGPILENKTILRNAFLDSDCEYFLLLGGDNPPPRNALKALMTLDAGVAMGTCYQRPEATELGVYPLVWRFLYSLEDIDKVEVDEVNRRLIKQSWLNSPCVINVSYDPDWKKNQVLWSICGGDGCALIKRKVLEDIDWGVMPLESCSCSEDMHFMASALYYGYSTACLPNLHIGHMSESGLGV